MDNKWAEHFIVEAIRLLRQAELDLSRNGSPEEYMEICPIIEDALDCLKPLVNHLENL